MAKFTKWTHLIPLILILVTYNVNCCEYHICSNEYAEHVLSKPLLTHGPSTDVHGSGDNSSPSSSSSQMTKEQSEYCNLLNAYNQCMRTQSKSCRGNMNYHGIVAMVRKWLKESNCTGSYHKSRQGIRSQVSNIATIKRQQEQRKKEELLQKKLEICFSDAFNFTIDPVGFVKQFNMRSEQHSRTINGAIDDGHFFSGTKVIDGPDSLLNDSPFVPILMSAVPPTITSGVDHGSTSSSRTARSHDNLRSLPPPVQDSSDQDADQDDSDDRDNDDSDESDAKEGLLCLLYGDPHLRTFKNEFMTCRCLGAWPMIDHPLFAVQVTHTKDDLKSQISGVSKVTVIVRRFTSCGIKHDLIYEADSSPTVPSDDYGYGHGKDDGHFANDTSLPVSFIDGSINTPNNMVRITKLSVDGPDDEVCIEMRHINVHVCVNQLVGGLNSRPQGQSSVLDHIQSGQSSGHGTNYLNVQIKFKPMIKSDRDAIIASLSENSLCKIGCPIRERIDIESILDAAGFNLLDSLHINMDANSEANISTIASVPECNGLYGYYLLSCLFDVKMKGLTSTDIHKSSQSKDHTDISMIHKCYIESRKLASAISRSTPSFNYNDIILPKLIMISSVAFAITLYS